MAARLDALYVTEAEAAARLGMPLREWIGTATVLERDGLPRKDPVFNDRRYWPAVKAFLDRRAGLGQDAGINVAGRRWEENWDDEPRARRPRAAKAGS